MIYFHTDTEFEVKLGDKPFRVRPLSYKDWLAVIKLEDRLFKAETPFEEKHALALQILNYQVVRGEGERPLEEMLTFAGVQELMRLIAEAVALTPDDRLGFPSPRGPEPASSAASAASSDAA